MKRATLSILVLGFVLVPILALLTTIAAGAWTPIGTFNPAARAQVVSQNVDTTIITTGNVAGTVHVNNLA